MENKSVCAKKRRERDRSHETRTQRMVLKLGGATLVADDEGAWAHHEV